MTVPSSGASAPPPRVPKTQDEILLEAITKATKLNDASFKEFTREDRFKEWYEQTLITARAQACSLPFDQHHATIPGSYGAQLFEKQQMFIFSVLKSKVLTSKGKEIVNKYLTIMDAQTRFYSMFR